VTAYATDLKLAREVARVSAGRLRAAVADFGGRVPAGARIQVVVHSGRDAYLSADQQPRGGTIMFGRDGTAGMTYPTKDARGRSIIRVETFAGQSGLLDGVVPHEVVHVAQHYGFAAFGRAHWLDEGLAMLAESKASQAQRRAWFERSEERFTLTELTAFRSTPPDGALLFYNQAYVLTAHLRRRGTESDWRRFLKKMATADFESAVDSIYGGLGVDPFAG
jgi:hypothetical protein